MSDQSNPYASPVVAAEFPAEEERPRPMKIASQGKRFLNYLIDTTFLIVLFQFVGFFIGVAYGLWLVVNQVEFTPEMGKGLEMFILFFNLSLMVVYYVVLEMFFQRTLAKLITGTLVVNEAGLRPSLMQVVGRSFARFVPFEAFTFLGSGRPVGVHDKWSGTRVINLR